MQHIETEILINASPEKVWTVLTDFERYPTWNPFIKSINGEKGLGKQLKVSIQPPDGTGMTFKPKVLAFDANKEFRWKGKLFFKGIFDGEHYFRLTDAGNGTTRFSHGEKFSGFLVALMGGTLDKTKVGFELMNEALKWECERV
ncbi:SRPBCC domain-containing protein [Pontibacter sp. HSC-14F20]|uniref:SRPBCC domain-containing protein n=1 Tax=Pontibacter sp. HSC-14F20 TaxID=2864136 RepID=UPI001C732B7D|nr:SRPBCC domain-containing protein [Pontibacter sp. HSC-14F20]MBX0333801.1 SRPBCC domain-containing protein [Pontibacter sp. HSC-14F20]